MSLSQATQPHNESFGTLEYYQAELGSETPWRRLAAARNLADKAASNFERTLKADYQKTLGVDAEETDLDETMVQEVKAQCEALHQKIVRDLQTERPNDVNRVKNLNGQYMSPVLGLFRLATLENTDGFLDIATLNGDFSFDSLVGSTADGVFDKYGFNIDSAQQRQQAIVAMISETDPTLYAGRVRT